MDKHKNQDWRIEDYRGHLDSATFILIKFTSTATNDHEHCVFCWQKITDLKLDDCDKEGYCTFDPLTNQTTWVCKTCFNDFKEKFKFKLK